MKHPHAHLAIDAALAAHLVTSNPCMHISVRHPPMIWRASAAVALTTVR